MVVKMENKDSFENTRIDEVNEISKKREVKRLTRKQAIRRRNIFLASVGCVAVLLIALIVFIISAIISGTDNDKKKENNVSSIVENSSVVSSQTEVSSKNSLDVSSVESNTSENDDSLVTGSKDESDDAVDSKDESASEVISSKEESSSQATSSKVNNKVKKLDPNFTNLLLVNGSNPLPENYDYEGNLRLIEDKYLCGWRNQMNADVYPYATAMVEAAWEDGVELYILSPYRSYSTQVTLYENEVKKWVNTGMKRKAAEDKAATVVARPGTSEHHTGMAIDFNSVEPSFENTPMYKWLDENAHNYGFILRYTEDKQPITGVIHEAWHWRFIGINAAKKYKASGNICLEEFVEEYGKDFE